MLHSKSINQSILSAHVKMSSNPLISQISRSIWPDFAARIFVVEFYVVAITEPLFIHHWCVELRESGASVCLRLVPTDHPLCPHTQGLLHTPGFLSCKSSFIGRKKLEILQVVLDGFGGIVVSTLASGTQVCGFKPGRSRWIFTSVKILSMPSSGGEVKESVPCPSFATCKRT